MIKLCDGFKSFPKEFCRKVAKIPEKGYANKAFQWKILLWITQCKGRSRVPT